MSNDSTREMFSQAVELHRDGGVAEAENLYRQILERDPGNLDAEYLSGTALLQLGRFESAIPRLKSVVERRPESPEAHNNLGVACKAVGDWEGAARSFQAALRVRPEYHQALFNLGAVMEHRQLFADAEKCFRHALQLQPDDADSRLCLANALKAQQKWNGAEAEYLAADDAGDREEERMVNLAFVLARQEKLADAAEIYRRLLERRPDFAEIHSSLSCVYEQQGRLDEAHEAARKAVACRPELSDAHNNLGNALRSLHRLDEATEAFREALRCNPDSALAGFNLGTTHLLAGNYREGWPGYERRTAALGLPPREFPRPRWNGESLDGGRLFVYADQGFGDALQFARFLAPARRRANATLVFECQPELAGLSSRIAGVDAVQADGDDPPEFDAWIPLASIPGVLNVDVESVFGGAYVEPPELRRELGELLSSRETGRPQIGLVWRGNPEQARDAVRSCSVDLLRPILETPGVEIVSLQTGPNAAEELAAIPPEIRPLDAGSKLRDFSDTAAMVAALDLVITVDTATAHLAGAMGADVWTLLPHTPDWRWGLSGDSTGWYPTMQLFRQPRWGDWRSVVENLKSALWERIRA